MESRACDRVSPKASMGEAADSCHGLTLLAPDAQWSCNRFVSLLPYPDIQNNFGMKELFFLRKSLKQTLLNHGVCLDCTIFIVFT